MNKNFQGDEWKQTEPSAYCQGVTEALASMCDSRPAYKKAIVTTVTGISCLVSGAKPAEKNDGSIGATLRNMALTGGTLTYRMSKAHANIKANAQTTIEKALH